MKELFYESFSGYRRRLIYRSMWKCHHTAACGVSMVISWSACFANSPLILLWAGRNRASTLAHTSLCAAALSYANIGSRRGAVGNPSSISPLHRLPSSSVFTRDPPHQCNAVSTGLSFSVLDSAQIEFNIQTNTNQQINLEENVNFNTIIYFNFTKLHAFSSWL